MSSIFDWLLHNTTGDAQAWSLPNIRGESAERWIGSRDRDVLEKFCKKRDEAGRGVFFCVSTIEAHKRRLKENASHLTILFVDVDFKDHDTPREEIERILREDLFLPPTRLHHTGNGIHAIWYLTEPLGRDEMDEAEDALRRLARHLGGDPSVAHRVALLRVPGTHNTKRGERHPVRVIHESAATYTLAEINAWLDAQARPRLVRREQEVEETNPFLEHAKRHGFRPPVDVEARLAAMRVQGSGDAGVHATQLSCTAAMMAAGVEIEDAVTVVLEATRELEGTDGWNWREEERALRKMCEDYLRKFAKDKSDPQPLRVVGGTSIGPDVSGTVSLADARKERADAKEAAKERVAQKLRKKLKNEHVVVGEEVLHELEQQGRKIMFTTGQCWLYANGLWTFLGAEEEKFWATAAIERACKELKMVGTNRIVSETRAWLAREDRLRGQNIQWDAHGGIAAQNGVVELSTGALVAPSPEQYVTRQIACEYIPGASCPTWEAMLREDYQFDEGTVSFLQEFLGAALVQRKPRTLMRALVLVGGSNSGKSNILNTLAGLVSSVHNPTPLQALENSHGMMPFLQPNPWVLHEAFEQSRWEMSSNAKALLSGDVVHVNVKNGPMIPLNFTQPILWGSNVEPQFREASRAMENRLAIVRTHVSFDPLHVRGTAQRAMELGHNNPAELVLATEKPGLLNWAIAGWRRAIARGHFAFTEEMRTNLHTMRLDSNMAAGFIEQCCAYNPAKYITIGDFYGAFSVWHTDHRGGHAPSIDSLGRAMKSLADNRIVSGTRIDRKRVIAGLELVEEGIDCWNAYSGSQAAERTGQALSTTVAEVNKDLPENVLWRPEFAALARAIPQS